MRNPVRLSLACVLALALAGGAGPVLAGSFGRPSAHAPKHHSARSASSVHPHALRGPWPRHRVHRPHRLHRPQGVYLAVPVLDSYGFRERALVESSVVESDGDVTIVIESADDGSDVITIILR